MIAQDLSDKGATHLLQLLRMPLRFPAQSHLSTLSSLIGSDMQFPFLHFPRHESGTVIW